MAPEDNKTDLPSEELPVPDDALDVDGHSFGAVVLGAAVVSSASRQRTPEKQPSDDALPPLTKPFPRMRDDKPRK
jgi:hypothetical protein